MHISKSLFLVSLCFDALEDFFKLHLKDLSIELKDLEEQGIIAKMCIYSLFGIQLVLS